MSSINKYLDVFERLTHAVGVTGPGYGPTVSFIIESSALRLCRDGKEVSTEKLTKEVEKIERDQYMKYYPEGGDKFNRNMELSMNRVKEVASVIECPFEDVPLHINAYEFVAREIAMQRLRIAE
jgi:adenylosuccinate synthase